MITKQDIDNMTPEELEELKRRAARAIIKRFAMIFLFKLTVSIALHRWAKRLKEQGR